MLTGVSALLAAGLVFAATPVLSDDYAMREWHIQDGLANEQVGRINQDADGYLWVSTIPGMARFDGMHFEQQPLMAQPGGYTRMTATSVTLGLIAAPYTRQGLMVLREGQFEPWRPEEFGERTVTALFAERDGTLWIGSDDGSVFRHADGKSTRFGAAEGLPRARQRWFASDGNGQVWIASEGAVVRYQDGEFIPVPDAFDGSELRIGSSANGGPWLITRDRLLRLEGGRARTVAELPLLLGAHYVQAVLEDHTGTLWIGTRSQGLHVITANGLEQVPTSHEDVFALCEDRDGNLWVGTNGGGLNRIRRKAHRLYDKSTGLRDNQTQTLVEDARGDLWFANRDGGAVRLHDGVLELMADRPGWPRLSTVSIFPLGPERIGVTTGSGVYEFSPDGPLDIRRVPRLPPSVRVTFAARNGDVWMSMDPDRVGRLRGGQLQVFGRASGMTGRQIRGIAEDASGRIWIGAADGKLFRSNGERFEAVGLGERAVGAIQAIRVEADGTVWLGTVSGGVLMLSGDRVRQCTEQHGLPDSNITQILADAHGYFWFGSKRGIFRLNRRDLLDFLDGKVPRVSPLMIGQDEGLKDLSSQGIFQPAAVQTRDGRLWFATRRGVLSIDPAIQLAPPTPPPVTIEEVRFDNQRVALTRPFRVPANVRKLEIRFGVLNLSAPDRVRAKYRLDGFDDDWVEASPGRIATYPRLPPGRYRFHVMASSGDGAVNEAGDSIDFGVEPRWWQTWWFRIAAVFAATLAVALTVRAWSHRRLRERLERLERERAIERERRRIAQNIHDDLGANLTRISLLTQHARHAASSGAGYFEQIHSTATDITRSMDEIVWAVNPKYDDLESLAGYLGDFAQGFLSVAGIRCRLDVPAQLPSIGLSSQTRHHLFLSCKEALNNVVKHAAADEVTITLAIRGDRLVISIQDNGHGLAAPEVVPASANAAAQRNGPAGSHDGLTVVSEHRFTAGAGLANMRHRMTELNGTCDIQTVEGKGVAVTFTVPLVLGHIPTS